MNRPPLRKLYTLEERRRRLSTKRWGPWYACPAHVYVDLNEARNGKTTLSNAGKGMRIYGEEFQVRIVHFYREKPKHAWQADRWREGKRS